MFPSKTLRAGAALLFVMISAFGTPASALSLKLDHGLTISIPDWVHSYQARTAQKKNVFKVLNDRRDIDPADSSDNAEPDGPGTVVNLLHAQYDGPNQWLEIRVKFVNKKIDIDAQNWDEKYTKAFADKLELQMDAGDDRKILERLKIDAKPRGETIIVDHQYLYEEKGGMDRKEPIYERDFTIISRVGRVHVEIRYPKALMDVYGQDFDTFPDTIYLDVPDAN